MKSTPLRCVSSGCVTSICAIAAMLVLPTGCEHQTMIKTNPEGATVYFDGAPVGVTPHTVTTRSGTLKHYSLKIEKKGFQGFEIELKNGYRPDESLFLLLPGILPYFWSARLENQYMFALIDENGNPPPPLPEPEPEPEPDPEPEPGKDASKPENAGNDAATVGPENPATNSK